MVAGRRGIYSVTFGSKIWCVPGIFHIHQVLTFERWGRGKVCKKVNTGFNRRPDTEHTHYLSAACTIMAEIKSCPLVLCDYLKMEKNDMRAKNIFPDCNGMW